MAPRPDQAAVAAATAAATYQAAMVALRQRLMGYIAALWHSFAVYHDAQARDFVAATVPMAAGAQQWASSLTAAYLDAQRRAGVGSGYATLVDPTKMTGAAVRKADPSVVYHRPFGVVWREISRGVDPTAAIDAGLARARNIALTDVQLAKTHTAHALMAADARVLGYRRVLEGEYSCDLCRKASTMRYHRGDLLPIHPRCDCSIEPIYSAGNHGITARYAHLPDVVVHQHGEIGPLLAPKGETFTPDRE